MRRDENGIERWLDGEFTGTEIEEGGKRAVVGELDSVTSQFIKEAVGTGFQWREPRGRCILQQARAECYGLGWRSRFEHLCPGVSFNLWELELRVVGVHFSDLFPGWCSQHLDDLHQLVYPTVPRENGLAQEKLGQYAAS